MDDWVHDPGAPYMRKRAMGDKLVSEDSCSERRGHFEKSMENAVGRLKEAQETSKEDIKELLDTKLSANSRILEESLADSKDAHRRLDGFQGRLSATETKSDANADSVRALMGTGKQQPVTAKPEEKRSNALPVWAQIAIPLVPWVIFLVYMGVINYSKLKGWIS